MLDHDLEAGEDVALPVPVEDHRHPHAEQLRGRPGTDHVDVHVLGRYGEVKRGTNLVDTGQDLPLDPEVRAPQLGTLSNGLIGCQVVVHGVG